MSIAVRPACPEDSSEILRLLRLLAAFEQSPDGVTITEDVIRRDGFGDDRRFEVLLAEVDGRVRGGRGALSGLFQLARVEDADDP